AGAEVTLITTSALPSSEGIERVEVITAADLYDAVNSHLPGSDAVVMAAAVADFTPATLADHKIKKDVGVPDVKLVPTTDILAELGRRKAAGEIHPLLIGFAAETQNIAANARSKLESKGADLIVANDVAGARTGFGHNTNAVTIFSADGGEISLSLRSKAEIATELCAMIAARL
ncbi:MAG: bifunctional phosphopantothenoylcysteine decarboxylase/phosphopantothenate--cysteine ligase CoaBC, partial [Acidimicrobiales bacterium]|nr:bifunctional phosphopantothenoylcysteine decarboxylase/phosphopantothenate--cysteine ligase CoaBC [Acidimicrobiales bacterium]